jgi:hypothetical protein
VRFVAIAAWVVGLVALAAWQTVHPLFPASLCRHLARWSPLSFPTATL